MKPVQSTVKRAMLLMWVAALVVFACTVRAYGQSISTEAYTWKNVQIVGGGFVDGIIFHPTAKGVCYCRTDMGGAYRRNPETLRWEPLLDWLSYQDVNLMGVESIALDPSDPDKVYLACGTYTSPNMPNGAILRSGDRGKTFLRTDVPFKMGGNEDGRGNGERMAVDPNNGNVLYMGTRHAGLWKSTDGAVSWSRVVNFPDVTEVPPAGMKDRDSINRWMRMNQGSGIIFVIFDPASGKKGKGSSLIYAGVSLMNRPNIFCSRDGGQSWKPLDGEPEPYRPTHAVLSPDGILYVSYGNAPGPSRMTDGAIWKFEVAKNRWMDITPDKPDPKTRAFGYAAVAVDVHHPQTLIASTYFRYSYDNGEEIFRSTDAGESWKQVFKSGAEFDHSLAPYTSKASIHWMFDIEIDPNDPSHAMFTTGFGGYETFDLTGVDRGKPTHWRIMSTGIEETVALDLLSPPAGAHLLSAIGDYCGFVHNDMDKPAPEGAYSNPSFGNTNGIACAENNPAVIVRVGRGNSRNEGKNIGYSLDGGKTWQPTSTQPSDDCSLGHISVSSDGKTWIWSPDPLRGGFGPRREFRLLPVYRTQDMGASWTECRGISGNTRVVADRTNPERFYAMDLFNGILYVSQNSGADFFEQTLSLPDGLPKRGGNRGDSRGGQDCIYTAPGKEGDLWIAAFNGLYHSSDAGKTFDRLAQVSEIHGFGFGKAAPGSSYPALYLVGTINNARGIFRSIDEAHTWVRINDDQHQWGLVLHVTGDPTLFGRVYAGTHGRGIFYGDPQKNASR